MKLVYTHANKILVENVKNLLEQEGIASSLKNEYASGAVGELSAIDTWPELWVSDEYAEKSERLVNRLLNEKEENSWRCSGCGEHNGAAFEFCWKCNAASAQGV